MAIPGPSVHVVSPLVFNFYCPFSKHFSGSAGSAFRLQSAEKWHKSWEANANLGFKEAKRDLGATAKSVRAVREL